LSRTRDRNKIGGEKPIEGLFFLRTLKEVADRDRVSEGAAPRLIPNVIKGISKEVRVSGPTRGCPSVDAEVNVYRPVPRGNLRYGLELSKAYYAAYSAPYIEG
jgi:hypothetical protein